jgi:C7-cyclitol 7-kinase
VTDLVLEVGGTTLRGARYDPVTATVSRRVDRRTPSPFAGGSSAAQQQRVLDAMAALGRVVMADRSPERVGVAYAGPVAPDGRVLAAPTILRRTGSEPFDLRAACADLWPGAAVVCVNDLTAAGLSYAADGRRDFAVLTVGSGIGHKVFLDGVPRVGHGRGGELGHLRLDYSADAPVCDCGGRGHLGALASGRGTTAMVVRHARSHPELFARSALGGLPPESIDGVAVAEAFRAGDPFTRSAVHVSVRHLGTALAALHLDTGVEDILLVGGFATGMGEDYRRLLVGSATDAAWAVGQDWERMLRFGERADTAALRGAGLAARGWRPGSEVRTDGRADAGGQGDDRLPPELLTGAGHVGHEAPEVGARGPVGRPGLAHGDAASGGSQGQRDEVAHAGAVAAADVEHGNAGHGSVERQEDGPRDVVDVDVVAFGGEGVHLNPVRPRRRPEDRTDQ